MDQGDSNNEFSLGMTAEEFYATKKSKRTGPVSLARRIANITIPTVFPPENWQTGEALPITRQSVNTQLVNGLAASLMLSALPPGLPMAEHTVEEHKLSDDIAQDPELFSQIEYALSRREEQYRKRMELTMARTVYGKVIRTLLIAGNQLCVWEDINTPVTYSMHHYVVERDSLGNTQKIVLEQSVPLIDLDEDIREMIEDTSGKNENDKDGEDNIKVYKCQKLVLDDNGDKEWVSWQEIKGKFVEDSESYSPFETPPMYAAWMLPDENSDWGTPYCSDYEGDLSAVENYGAALVDFSADASFNLTFVDPTGQTDIRDVEEADNLDILPGRAQDVTKVQSQKTADYSVTASEFEKAARRLGFAFNSKSAIQRDAERVTQEEWQQLALELDKAMGGVYSDLAQTFQKWFVLRFIHLFDLDAGSSVSPLPEGVIKLGVKTGIDNIGKSSEHGKLMGFAREGAEVLGPEGFNKAINPQDFLRRLATARSVKSEGLIRSEQELSDDMAAEKQEMQQNELMKGAAPAIAKGGMAMASQMMEQQQGISNE